MYLCPPPPPPHINTTLKDDNMCYHAHSYYRQPPTKIVGKVEHNRLDFDYISKDLIYRYVLCIYAPPLHPISMLKYY